MKPVVFVQSLLRGLRIFPCLRLLIELDLLSVLFPGVCKSNVAVLIDLVNVGCRRRKNVL